MPTYEYACTECGERLEVVQRFSDDPLTVCSDCGGKLRKVFSPVGIVFKGSGFYRTDSRSGNVAAGAGKGTDGSAGESSGSSDGKSEAAAKTSKSENGKSGSDGGGSGSSASSSAESKPSSANGSSKSGKPGTVGSGSAGSGSKVA